MAETTSSTLMRSAERAKAKPPRAPSVATTSPAALQLGKELGEIFDGHALHLRQIPHRRLGDARRRPGEEQQAVQPILDTGADVDID